MTDDIDRLARRAFETHQETIGHAYAGAPTWARLTDVQRTAWREAVITVLMLRE